jgi:hypothetical protein
MKRLALIIVVPLALALAGAAWAEQPVDEQPRRLALDLYDGSHLIGVPNLDLVSVQTPYARMDIPLKQIRSVKMGRDHETASIDMCNGDMLKGVVSLDPMKLRTVFGAVSIGIELIKELRVLPTGRAMDGLASWWRAEGNTLDSVGPNSGSARSVVGYAPGMVGTAFDFNGVNTFIELSNTPSLNPTGSLSIEGWIYPRVDQGNFIFSKWSGGGDYAANMSYGFHANTGRGLSFAVSDLAHEYDSGFHNLQVHGVLKLNAWNHVAAVYDQATGARQIYVNGVKVAERIDPAITILAGFARVTIGANSPNSSTLAYFFDGRIDELSFYSKALSPDEILAIYNAGSAGK